MAEWLRRWTANPLCSARVGSNPILVDNFFFSTFPTLHYFLLHFAKQFTLSWCVLSCHSLWTCTEKQKERKLFCLSGVDRLCRDKSLLYVLGFTDAQKLLFSTKTKTSTSKNRDRAITRHYIYRPARNWVKVEPKIGEIR